MPGPEGGPAVSSEINRYKVNQLAQACLVRHAVDLSKLNFSFTGQSLHLSGLLRKSPAGEFSAEEIKTLVLDLARLDHVRYLQAELDNWSVSQEFGTWDVRPKLKDKRRR